MDRKRAFPALDPSPVLPVTAGVLAVAIFVVDAATRLDMAIAALYVVVVLIAVGFLDRRGVILVAAACLMLTVVAYLLAHGLTTSTALGRFVMSVAAIGITAFLALKNQAANIGLVEQAQLLDLTHDTIFVRDMNDVITYWNRGAEQLYGWPSEQAVGKPARQLMQTVLPTPLEEITVELLRAGRWEGELVHTKRDGTQVIVDSRWSLQRDERGRPSAIMETNNDISGRKAAEEALRRSEALLAETQELTHTGSVGYDAVTGEVFWSAEGARIFGHDPSTEPTLDLLVQRVHPDDAWLARRSINRTDRGEPDNEFDIRLVMPDGAIKYVHAVSHAVRDASARRALRALIDVTAAREAEAALHRAQGELAHVSRMTALGELSASIAHEVNQPLAAIMTNGQACLRWLDRDMPDLDETRGAVTRIIGDADRASEVIRRIRALSQKSDPHKVALNLNEVIHEVVLLVRREVQSHHVSLELDLASGLPRVPADRVQLQQVLINLMVNAIQAMTPVTDRPRILHVRSQPQEDHVLVAVQDSGIGIEPTSESRLFDAFFTTKPDGVGMGLSICRSIVEAHGGEVWVSRNDGPGTTFQFTLPSSHEG